MKIKLKELLYALLIVLLTAAAAYIAYLIGNRGTIEALKTCGIICLIHFISICYSSYRFTKKLFCLYNCYLYAFFVFQCGQYVLYGLNAEYNYFYIELYETKTVIEAIIYSIMCNGAAFLAVPFCMENRPGRFVTALDKLDKNAVYYVSKVFFWCLSLIEWPYLLIRFLIVLRSGYQGVRAFEGTVPSIMTLIDMLYIPSILLCILYTYGNKKRYLYVIIMWAIINALNGDRSSGIAALVVVGLLYLNKILQRKNEKHERRNTVLFLCIGLFAAFLIPYAYNFRNQLSGISEMSVLSIGITVIGDLGFSFFPLVTTMRICPSTTGFLYGKPIFFSILAGLFPSSLDLTGVVRQMYEIAKTAESWLTTYYHFTFGLGYSLDAEGYANFGMLGFVWIFIQSIFVAKVLSEPDFRRTDNKFSQYKSLALLFILFTMPRRWTYYLVNFYVYYVFWIGVLLYLGSKSIKLKKY